METKICCSCRKELPATLEYFYKDKTRKFGLSIKCKECYGRHYVLPVKPKDGFKICSKCKRELPATTEYFYYHKEPILQSSCIDCYKKYAIENKDRIILYRKEYYENHKDEINLKNNAYAIEHKEELKIATIKWRENNRDRINSYKNNKYHNDERFNLDHKMSNAIRKSLKKNKAGRNWESLVGYTLDVLIIRLKNVIPEGYVWDDVLSGKLEIDHITPKSLFEYNNTDQIAFRKCWALDNLQLLPKKQNRDKWDYYDKPFQFYLPM